MLGRGVGRFDSARQPIMDEQDTEDLPERDEVERPQRQRVRRRFVMRGNELVEVDSTPAMETR